MTRVYETWEPLDPSQWERALGLVRVPLFGPQASAGHAETYSVLVDGRASSFLLITEEDEDLRNDGCRLSWAWSSNVRHALTLDGARQEMSLSRWDSPGMRRRFKLPERPQGASDLLRLLESSSPPKATDVILHVLRAFRQLRMSLPGADNLHAIQLFNALLVGAEAVSRGLVERSTWERARTYRDALGPVEENDLIAMEIESIPDAVLSSQLGGLLDLFLQPEPLTGSLLRPDLLLRHAAGQLYQEAHLIMEREMRQLSFPGLSPDRPSGTMENREVRFTPTPLARALVQQAFNALRDQARKKDRIEILDPACGSGVFLQETLRELQARGFKGQAILRGFDISEISCAMARFVVMHAKRDAEATGIQVDVHITNTDALATEWGSADLVLMNPPFASLETMKTAERKAVRGILGSLDRGRIDKSMAFLLKAMAAVQPAGVVASVVPASLLETESGNAWREELSRQGDPYLIGHFRGYGFFTGSVVQPGFIVLRRPATEKGKTRPPVKIVIAGEGKEDNAIRALRQHDTFGQDVQEEGWEVSEIPADLISPTNWLPRSGRYQWFIDRLAMAHIPVVGSLFNVQQGIRTGRKRVFLVTESELGTLPPNEREFFRPIASNSTIECGRIERNCFLFYPYDADGLILRAEDDLQAQVPAYYETRLLPEKSALCVRAGVDVEKWWALIRDRPWQRVPAPKLVSKAFGGQGAFAYDHIGDTVVLQACAWLWKRAQRNDNDEFHETPMHWAYLALLNSGLYETLLGFFCPQVRGGQFDLSPRFVERIFLPDLTDDLLSGSSLIHDLAWLGQQIHNGQYPPVRLLDEAAARAYGVSADDLDAVRALQSGF